MKPFASSFTLSGLSKNLRFLKGILLLFQYCKDIPQVKKTNMRELRCILCAQKKKTTKALLPELIRDQT